MKAIGVSFVSLNEMNINSARNEGYSVDKSYNEYEGYEVSYANGNYKTWMPASLVNKLFFTLDKNNDGSIIIKEDVNNFITGYKSKTIGDKTTLVEAKTITNFDYIESSTCVSKENYNQEIGTDICMNKIVDKVWEHLGFVLNWAKNGINRKIDFTPSNIEHIREELNELEEKIRKLNNFIEFNEVFGELDNKSKEILKEEQASMIVYKSVLNRKLSKELEKVKLNKPNKTI